LKSYDSNISDQDKDELNRIKENYPRIGSYLQKIKDNANIEVGLVDAALGLAESSNDINLIKSNLSLVNEKVKKIKQFKTDFETKDSERKREGDKFIAIRSKSEYGFVPKTSGGGSKSSKKQKSKSKNKTKKNHPVSSSSKRKTPKIIMN